MGRQCYCPGCNNTSGLHSFPADPDIRLRWFRALSLPVRDLPLRAGLCGRHFSRDCFSNTMELDLGFSSRARLRPDAVPDVALPPAAGSSCDPAVCPTVGETGAGCHSLIPCAVQNVALLVSPPPTATVRRQQTILPKPTTETGCQTERVLNKHFFGQVDLKPYRRSKATQAQNPNTRSVYCDTGTVVAAPQILRVVPTKRTRSQVSADDSSCQQDGTTITVKCTSSSDEPPALPVTKYTFHEGNLMELFEECPICTQSCDISKTFHGTVLQVKQSCTYCDYSHQWSSQPVSPEEAKPAGKLEGCAADVQTLQS